MFNVLAFANEVCSRPSMLQVWLDEFGGDEQLTLTVYAPGGNRDQLHADLQRAFDELDSIDPGRRLRIREVVATAGDPAEAALIDSAAAVYSFRRHPAPFHRLPRIGRGDFGAFRCLCGLFKDASEHPEAPPDFIGVAAQKAGTTWWCELIRRHPAVHRSPRFPKEARFFSMFRGFPPASVPVEKYASLFPRPAGTICGEWTPDYVWDPGCAEMLHRAAPNAKLLVLLRDPVERYISGLTHRVMYREPVSAAAAQMAFEAGLYGRQIAGLLEFFPRERLLVLQYERCCIDPAGQIERTYRFLELPDPGFVPKGLTAPIHATNIEKVPVAEATRAQLIEAYRTDSVQLLEMFPHLEMDLWTSLQPAQNQGS